MLKEYAYGFVPKPVFVEKGAKKGWSCLCDVVHKSRNAAFNCLVEDLVNEFADTINKPREELLLEVRYEEMIQHRRVGASLKRRGVSVSNYRQYLDQTFFYSAFGRVMQEYKYAYRENKLFGGSD